MNHIEALKVARDALEYADKHRGIPAQARITEALAATAIIDPVASIVRLDINDDGHFECLLGGMHPLSKSAITDFVNDHCATWAAQAHETAWVDAGREIDRIAKERDEARAQLARAVPDGWQPVPKQATREMIHAARDDHEGEYYLPSSLYDSMLAAAPKPPEAA